MHTASIDRNRTTNRRMSQRRRAGLGTLAAATTLLVASACKPVPTPATWTPTPTAPTTTTTTPPPTRVKLVVNSAGGDHDVAPGDGMCATDATSRTCTVQAAFDEANTHPRATIRVPEGIDRDGLTSPLTTTITGDIVLLPVDPSTADGPGIGPSTISIAEGASLRSKGVGFGFGDFDVDGDLRLSRTAIVGQISVSSTGTALLRNAYLDYPIGPAVDNQGRALVLFSTIGAASDEPAIATGASAVTTLGASYLFAEDGTGVLCTGGPPRSRGFNAFAGDSCGPAQPTDVALEPGRSYGTWPGPPLLDAIPNGSVGCGDRITTSLNGVPRPSDGEGDGDAACDIGAFETPAPD